MSAASSRAPMSLRWRLLLATAAVSLLAVVAAGWVLSALFREHVERQFADALVVQLDQVTARFDVDAAGRPVVNSAALSDPRWTRPQSGLYWQLDRRGAPAPEVAVLRSRSLWDAALALPDDALADGQVHVHAIDGPAGAKLLAVERTVRIGGEDTGTSWRVSVAGDLEATRAAMADFDRVLALSLAGLAGLWLLAAVAQVAIGLMPLRALKVSLEDLHAGRSSRLGGRFPGEVQPLVDGFNAVLQRREETVERSRAQAADLAHALKTPLAVMSQAAQAAGSQAAQAAGSQAAQAAGSQADQAAGSQADQVLARTVVEQVEVARRHVDRHLARARAAGRPGPAGTRADVATAVDGLVRVMERVHAARGLRIEAAIAPGLALRTDAQDAQEMIGNLLDNACKWARGRVRVSAAAASSDGGVMRRVAVTVEDDGPGIDAQARARALERGARLDESVPGSGLGLAIVQDLASLHGGTLILDTSSALGGLRAVLTLPGAGDVAPDR